MAVNDQRFPAGKVRACAQLLRAKIRAGFNELAQFELSDEVDAPSSRHAVCIGPIEVTNEG